MNILIATGLYPPESGGPATYTKLLEEHLPKLGITVSVLPFSRVRHLPKFFRHAVYFWKCFLMARTVDVVYAQDTVSVGFPAALASLLARKKFLVRVPGDYAWEQARQRFGVKDEIEAFQNKRYGLRVGILRAIQKFVVGNAKAVVVPSQYMQKIVSGWVDHKKIEVIYSTVHFPVPTEEPTDRPKGFLITTIARLVPWKGVDGLVRAIAQELSWQLTVVGDGPERSSLEELSRTLGVSERVQFTGQLPRAEGLGWAKVSDVFVLNSTYEGLSHVLIEVLSLGTPVLATTVGGNPELVGSKSLFTYSEDGKALLRAIKDIEKDARGVLGRAGITAEHAQRFSVDVTIPQLVTLLKTL